MIEKIVSQALFAPLATSLILLGILRIKKRLKPQYSWLIILSWLPIYSWVVNIPHIPPRLMTDWLGIIVIGLSIDKLIFQKNKSNLRLNGIFFICFIILFWPLLKQHTDINYWIEISGVYLIIAYSLSQSIKPQKSLNQEMFLAISGVGLTTGLLTIISGSLLLGLLSLSFSCLYLLPFLQRQHLILDDVYLPLIITSLLLLLSRQLAELNLITCIALMCANYIAVDSRFSPKLRLISYIMLIALAIIYTAITSTSLNYY